MDLPTFSLGLFGDVAAMWRDYQEGILPGPGGREDQNPNLLDAFAVLSAAEAEVQARKLGPPKKPAANKPARRR